MREQTQIFDMHVQIHLLRSGITAVYKETRKSIENCFSNLN